MRLPGDLRTPPPPPVNPTPVVGANPVAPATPTAPPAQATLPAQVQPQYRPGLEGRLTAQAAGSGVGTQAVEAGLRGWAGDPKVTQLASSFAQSLLSGVGPSFAGVADFTAWTVNTSGKLSGHDLSHFRERLASSTARLGQALALVDARAAGTAATPAQSDKVQQQAHSFALVALGDKPGSFASLAELTDWSLDVSFRLKAGTPELAQFRAELAKMHGRLLEAGQHAAAL